MEILACREALALSLDLQIRKVLVSSDCSTAVKEVNAGEAGRCAAIIKEINEISKEFESCIFIHERRSRNLEADALAKFSLSLDIGRHVWFAQPHDIVTIPVNLFE